MLVFAGLVVAAAGIFHSQPQPSQQTPGRIEVNVVNVPLVVTVTDGKGRLITGLKKADFKIYEDGKLQKTEGFSHEANLPLSVVLLVDTSSSTYNQLEFERSAARDFFSKVVKAGKDRAAIIGFDNTPRLMTDFTDDMEKLSAGLKKLDSGGGTAVYDAILETSEKKLGREAVERRKVIVLISDGYDTASEFSLKHATEMAQKRDVVIYAISINAIADTKGEEKSEGDKAIKYLVQETGGKAYYPKKLTDLGLEFEKIEEELRSQYVLSYIPANPFNGTFRKIRVDLANKSLKGRTRTGYYASK